MAQTLLPPIYDHIHTIRLSRVTGIGLIYIACISALQETESTGVI
jgi:hypothetical protein